MRCVHIKSKLCSRSQVTEYFRLLFCPISVSASSHQKNPSNPFKLKASSSYYIGARVRGCGTIRVNGSSSHIKNCCGLQAKQNWVDIFVEIFPDPANDSLNKWRRCEKPFSPPLGFWATVSHVVVFSEHFFFHQFLYLRFSTSASAETSGEKVSFVVCRISFVSNTL